MNSLMAMCGGIIAALIAGDGDPGFIHNGALAGLVAVCAGSDVMHPIGSLFVGGVAGVIFVYVFQRRRPQMAVRRRAGRVGPARVVRAVGRHRLRHLRPEGVRRARRRQLLVAAGRQPDGRGLSALSPVSSSTRVVDKLLGFRLAAGGRAPRRRPRRSTRSAPIRKRTCAWGACETLSGCHPAAGARSRAEPCDAAAACTQREMSSP